MSDDFRGAEASVLSCICVSMGAFVQGVVRFVTRTTRRSCHDPETTVSNFWSPGVRGRPQRVPSASTGGRLMLLLAPPPPAAAAAAVAAGVCRQGGIF